MKYQIVIDIAYLYNSNVIADTHEIYNYSNERVAIKYYKDDVWNIQGIINNTIVQDDSFSIFAQVTLFKFDDNDCIIMRHYEEDV